MDMNFSKETHPLLIKYTDLEQRLLGSEIF